jgi:cell division protein FtsL
MSFVHFQAHGVLFKWVLLLAIFLGSAMGVIHSKYYARGLFTEIQNLKKKLDYFEVQWGQMQLELMTLADHNRIERKARNELGLVDPEQEKVIYIKP